MHVHTYIYIIHTYTLTHIYMEIYTHCDCECNSKVDKLVVVVVQECSVQITQVPASKTRRRLMAW